MQGGLILAKAAQTFATCFIETRENRNGRLYGYKTTFDSNAYKLSLRGNKKWNNERWIPNCDFTMENVEKISLAYGFQHLRAKQFLIEHVLPNVF